MLARGVRRNDRLAAAIGQPVAEPAGVVGPVGQEFAGRGYARQQSLGPGQVVGMAGCQDQRQWATQLIGQRMNLGRPSAA